MPKKVGLLCVGLFVAVRFCAAATPEPYPNELNGMHFYARYLAPLRPFQSDTKHVQQVLGSDQELELKDWTIIVLYSCKEDFVACSHGPRNDPLDTIRITPKHRFSMRRVKFPPAFAVSYGSVSEINVTCIIYSDAFGLEYWVVSNDFGSHKKGDLLWINYRPAHSDDGAVHR